jgi:hypothetical protein
MSVERTDVAYVGEIRSDQFCMILLKDTTPTNYTSSLYYTFYALDTSPITIVLGQDGIGGLATGDPAYGTTPLLFKIISVSDYSFHIQVFNQLGGRYGWLSSKYDDGLRNNLLTLSDVPQEIYLTTNEPNMNLSRSILAGVRYQCQLDYQFLCNVARECSSNSSPEYGGLIDRCSTYEPTSINSFNWTFIPIEMAAYTKYVPRPLNLLPGTVAITQCINIPGSNYGRSSYCSNWKQYTGFTLKDYERDFIYYYSKDGSCGQSYTWKNWLGWNTDVSTSLGICKDQVCEFEDDIFKCVDEELELESGVNENIGDEAQAARFLGIIDYPILVLIIVISAFIIVILVIIIIWRILKN